MNKAILSRIAIYSFILYFRQKYSTLLQLLFSQEAELVHYPQKQGGKNPPHYYKN